MGSSCLPVSHQPLATLSMCMGTTTYIFPMATDTTRKCPMPTPTTITLATDRPLTSTAGELRVAHGRTPQTKLFATKGVRDDKFKRLHLYVNNANHMRSPLFIYFLICFFSKVHFLFVMWRLQSTLFLEHKRTIL